MQDWEEAFFMSFVLVKWLMQDVLLPERQTLRGDSRHEDRHYWIGNHGVQTSSVGARGH